jgi:hypothetical protein
VVRLDELRVEIRRAHAAIAAAVRADAKAVRRLAEFLQSLFAA